MAFLGTMSISPSLNEKCVLVFALGIALILLAYWPVGWFLCWLRSQSRILGTRSVQETGVPPGIVGNFERLLAFFLVLFQVDGTYAILAAWLGAKLAASWQRVPIETEDAEAGRQVRAGTLSALIAGIVSVLVGVLVGLSVHCACK
jgi:hypothetical protein